MWEEGKSGNVNGRPKKGETFKDYCDKWAKRIKKVVKVEENGEKKEYKINGKEYSVIVIFKMIQDDNTPPAIRLQAIKLMLEYTEGKPQPEVVSNVTVQNVQETAKNSLDSIKDSLDKLSPEERETYFNICEKMNEKSE